MGRRKSKEELAEELLGDSTDDESEDSPQADVARSEALSETEREEANELFDLLNSNGYMTLGNYSLQYVEEYDHVAVTFSAVLPSSNDWDPAMAYEDDDE